MTESEYVTNAAWLRTTGREDAIDEIADQFERPRGAVAFWSGRGTVRSLGLRPAAPLQRDTGARLAG